MQKKADISTVNHINTRNILKIIRSSAEPVFKAEIARTTGLSIPTVMRITDDLKGKGLLKEVGKGESNGGKPPQLLEFIGSNSNIIGVDISNTLIRAICVNLDGAILYKHQLPVSFGEKPEELIEHIETAIHHTMENAGIPSKNIIGIGIAMPGFLDHEKKIVRHSPDFAWRDLDIVDPIRKSFKLPVHMENDSRAKAMGEMWYGMARNEKNFICINYGYGIGSAFVMEGKVFGGSSGKAGEFGHVILDRGGAQCDCGNYGCTEALASGNAIAKAARRAVFRGAGRNILKLADCMEGINEETVFEAAVSGDDEANEIVDKAIEYLGLAIANLITLLDPNLVIIENYYEKYGDFLLSKITADIERYMMKGIDRCPQIVLSSFGEEDGSIGAAAILFAKWSELGFNKNLL